MKFSVVQSNTPYNLKEFNLKESDNNEYRGGVWWVTKVVDFVFKTLSPLLARDRDGTKTG